MEMIWMSPCIGCGSGRLFRRLGRPLRPPPSSFWLPCVSTTVLGAASRDPGARLSAKARRARGRADVEGKSAVASTEAAPASGLEPMGIAAATVSSSREVGSHAPTAGDGCGIDTGLRLSLASVAQLSQSGPSPCLQRPTVSARLPKKRLTGRAPTEDGGGDRGRFLPNDAARLRLLVLPLLDGGLGPRATAGTLALRGTPEVVPLAPKKLTKVVRWATPLPGTFRDGG